MADKPFADLADRERSLDETETARTLPPNEFERGSAETEPAEPTEPADRAHQRLRAFEDEHLGEDVPRISGKIERGHGSKYQRLSDDEKAEHAALERLMQAEKDMQDATAALEIAQQKHAAAAEHVDRAAAHREHADALREDEKRAREQADGEHE